jgi:spore germination protein
MNMLACSLKTWYQNMEIYIVQADDSLQSIANKFNISILKLISDNGLINATALVPGQALVILKPKETYQVRQGDSIASIAEANHMTVLQLLKNNPFLYYNNELTLHDSIVLHYDTKQNVEINGYAYSFTNLDILQRTLPYLTYISVFNYRIIENATIISLGEDYQTIPILMISAFSLTGDINLEIVYNLLLDEVKQDKIVNEMIRLVDTKGFMGVNVLISNINEANQKLYINVLNKLSLALRNKGYLFMITINPRLSEVNNALIYENINYFDINSIVDRIIFLNTIWGINRQPPSPVSNITLIQQFIESVSKVISPTTISIGAPLIGYDWEIPFDPTSSFANSMSLNNTITLAYEQKSIIDFDHTSQTPFFNYTSSKTGAIQNHVVWFIDARSIDAINQIILNYGLSGSGVWNMSIYNQQLWSILNATFQIIKYI